RDLHRAELLAIPVTLLVLLFAFGSLTAAVVPVLLALSAVAAGLGLLGPLSQLFPVEDSAKTVVLLIGMAVGVDYALFFVVRSRAERHRGAGIEEALAPILACARRPRHPSPARDGRAGDRPARRARLSGPVASHREAERPRAHRAERARAEGARRRPPRLPQRRRDRRRRRPSACGRAAA